jgi:hypothetical protein
MVTRGQAASQVKRGRAFSISTLVPGDRPLTTTWPAVGSSRPAIIRIVVDFPAPFGPRKPVTIPG